MNYEFQNKIVAIQSLSAEQKKHKKQFIQIFILNHSAHFVAIFRIICDKYITLNNNRKQKMMQSGMIQV